MLLVWVAQPLAATKGGLRYTITVSEFENRCNWSGQWSLGDAWSTILTDELNQTGSYIVVAERDMRQAAMEEQALGASGLTAQGKKTPQRGRMTPVQLLVKGVITKFETRSEQSNGGLSYRGVGLKNSKQTTTVSVTLQIVDTSTGRVVASKSVDGEVVDKKRSLRVNTKDLRANKQMAKDGSAHDALRAAVKEAVNWMSDRLESIPWRATVALVDGERVIINRGQREGVGERQRFIFGESEVITDPDTGEILEDYVREEGRLEVVQVNEKTSICRVVSGDVTTVYSGLGVQPVF